MSNSMSHIIPEDSTFIIAEAGNNHNGDLGLAKELVKEAATAGADAVKFQLWEASEFHSTPDQYNRLDSLQFAPAEWGEIKDVADNAGIPFFASTCTKASVDLLVDELDAPLIKVASGDITHIPLLEHIAEKNRPVILSTGMSTLGEVERAIEAVEPPNAQLCLLECLSSYPADLSDLNLKAIGTLESAFGHRIGYSDHTLGTIAPTVAVAMGASIVEKHFTLDNDMEGADHELSSEPGDFAMMVDQLRAIEEGVGDGRKRPMPAESESREVMRRGLKARDDIAAGEMFTAENVKIARPRSGIEPRSYDTILGRDAQTVVEQDEPITWDDVA
jgi:N,N'-diacetyllegionaminate synthase